MTRDIVLVTIDSLRADHCGHWGYEKNITPTLDQMAETGLVFNNAVAPGPATPESMPVVMTGEYPVETQEPAADAELSRYQHRIRDHMSARNTVAEQFTQAGYSTAAFTPNPFTSRHFGFDQGFDRFEDFMDARPGGELYTKIFEGFLEGNKIANAGRAVINRLWQEEVFKPWESFFDEAISWAAQQDGPFFLWLFLMDVHNPYLASREYRTQSWLDTFRANLAFWRQSHETGFKQSTHERLVRAYDDAVRYVDGCLAELRTRLSDATIVVHSDHGEAFGEHGFYGHEPYLYDENIHVPLVVENGPQGRVDQPVELRRLPELLQMLAADDESFRTSNMPALSRTAKGDKTAVRGSIWKYLQDGADQYVYDLRQDETVDRTEELPALSQLGRRLVEQARQANNERTRVVEAAKEAQK